jgi:hypothetical protein
MPQRVRAARAGARHGLPPRPSPPRPSRADLSEPVSLEVAFGDSSDRACKWPTSGHGRDLKICGHPVWFIEMRGKDSSYCEYHYTLSCDLSRRGATSALERMAKDVD